MIYCLLQIVCRCIAGVLQVNCRLFAVRDPCLDPLKTTFLTSCRISIFVCFANVNFCISYQMAFDTKFWGISQRPWHTSLSDTSDTSDKEFRDPGMAANEWVLIGQPKVLRGQLQYSIGQLESLRGQAREFRGCSCAIKGQWTETCRLRLVP